MKKYNLSFKRIVSRLFLTGVMGIIFGIAIFPFMRVADGLLYEQRAAIGGQNIYKMIALWGMFTLIVSFFTFWKKRFRMVSVLLIACWILSILFGIIVFVSDKNSLNCKRANPYVMPSEFTRSLDLISQRMGVDKTAGGTIWQLIFNYRNCLDIQYLDKNDNLFEAYFEYPEVSSSDNLQDLKILVNPYYQKFDDLTLATLLSHEIIHAGQYADDVINKNKLSCFEQEARAFTAQLIFTSSLNDEERRSIFARLQNNVDKNPIFKTLLLAFQRQDEAHLACLKLQKENSLTQEQFNGCVWTGAENKILQDIKSDPGYQKQCAENLSH